MTTVSEPGKSHADQVAELAQAYLDAREQYRLGDKEAIEANARAHVLRNKSDVAYVAFKAGLGGAFDDPLPLLARVLVECARLRAAVIGDVIGDPPCQSS